MSRRCDATALEKTGTVILSEGIIQLLAGRSNHVLAGIYFLTPFGQFISNTAQQCYLRHRITPLIMDSSPYTFLIAVAVGASMAFATPVASPTNALVMTAGNYKFFDFVKVGVPLQLVMFVVMMFVIPYFFPL